MAKVAFKQGEAEPAREKVVIYLQNPNKLSFNVNEAVEALGIGKTKLYELIKLGEIQAVVGGGRTLIPRSEAERWLRGLPRAAA